MNATRTALAVQLTVLAIACGSVKVGVIFSDDFNKGPVPNPAKWTLREDSGCSHIPALVNVCWQSVSVYDNVLPNRRRCLTKTGTFSGDDFMRHLAAPCVGVNMMSDSDRSGRSGAFSIEGISKFSQRQIRALKSRSLMTVESFVAAAATEEGMAGLSEALEIVPEALDELLREARNILGEKLFRKLNKTRPGGPTGTLMDEGPSGHTD